MCHISEAKLQTLAMSTLIQLLTEEYDLSVTSIIPFTPKNNKYQDTHYFWIVHTKYSLYFLKKQRYPEQFPIEREAEIMKQVRGYVAIPKIILSKNHRASITNNGSTYVLYQYIDAPNLLEQGFDTYHYLDVLCVVQNNFIAHNQTAEHYNFSAKIDHSITIFRKIHSVLESNPDNKTKVHDLQYVEFLISELHLVKDKLESIQVKTCLVHGDLLKQNIIIKNDKIWVIDWERARPYISIIDLLRSILYTITDQTEADLILDEETFLQYTLYCFEKVTFHPKEIELAMELLYFHLITNTDYLANVYLHHRKTVTGRSQADYRICTWFREHKNSLQRSIDNHFAIS